MLGQLGKKNTHTHTQVCQNACVGRQTFPEWEYIHSHSVLLRLVKNKTIPLSCLGHATLAEGKLALGFVLQGVRTSAAVALGDTAPQIRSVASARRKGTVNGAFHHSVLEPE